MVKSNKNILILNGERKKIALLQFWLYGLACANCKCAICAVDFLMGHNLFIYRIKLRISNRFGVICGCFLYNITVRVGQGGFLLGLLDFMSK